MEAAYINQTQESIVKAACIHFEITEENLISGTSFDIAYMRWCVFYLVRQHTQLNEKFIANRLNKLRNAFRNGVETIEVRKKIYGQTVDDLRKIEKLAGLSAI